MIFLFALVICRFRWLLTVITKFLSIVVSFYQIIYFFLKKTLLIFHQHPPFHPSAPLYSFLSYVKDIEV
ncbi:hypothetical protein DPX39_090081000 [Trypanosoma brucei equiperdum]|uniref:Uncharacterized protein n=1 Tax=Trypanosoma brucei equiperdum TaxID=630700 RepID=A0A3L6L1U8_9TRYP|nr:hypothetical protein DPX39_090081000 [Trypanosoma brucei equiperdum]